MKTNYIMWKRMPFEVLMLYMKFERILYCFKMCAALEPVHFDNNIFLVSPTSLVLFPHSFHARILLHLIVCSSSPKVAHNRRL